MMHSLTPRRLNFYSFEQDDRKNVEMVLLLFCQLIAVTEQFSCPYARLSLDLWSEHIRFNTELIYQISDHKRPVINSSHLDEPGHAVELGPS